MKYSVILAALLALMLGGCQSLNSAGVADYSVRPVQVGERIVCCEMSVHNGKQYASLDLVLVKSGDDYTVILRERGVEAFRGQQIAADAAASTMAGAVKAAGTVIVAPAAAAVGAAAIGALAQ